MRERVLKFIIMIIAVVAIGAGFTLLNLRLQGGTGRQEVVDFGREEALRNNTGAPEGAEAAAGEAQADAEAENIQPEQDAAGAAGAKDSAETGAYAQGQTSAETEAGAGEETISREDTADAIEPYESAAVEDSRQEVEINIQESSVSVEIVAESGPEEAAEDYYSRLSEMDSRLTANSQAAKDRTLADQQAAAEAALTFWDDELNMIYQALRDRMPEEEFIELRDEERAWIRQRDEAANQASVSQTQSSSAQNLAYTTSLMEWTRDRVYELAKMYYGQ